jgi:hypothetical protein
MSARPIALSKRRLAKRTKRAARTVTDALASPAPPTMDSTPAPPDALTADTASPSTAQNTPNEPATVRPHDPSSEWIVIRSADNAVDPSVRAFTDCPATPDCGSDAKNAAEANGGSDSASDSGKHHDDSTSAVAMETEATPATLPLAVVSYGDDADEPACPRMGANETDGEAPATMSDGLAADEGDSHSGHKRRRDDAEAGAGAAVVAKSVEPNAAIDEDRSSILPPKKRKRTMTPAEARIEPPRSKLRADDQESTAAAAVDDQVDKDDDRNDDDADVSVHHTTNMDDYKPAVRRLGIIRLFTFIEYMTALVARGACVSFDVGASATSPRHHFAATRRFGRGADGQRTFTGVDWHLSSGSNDVEFVRRALARGSTVTGAGTLFDPFVATTSSTVAAPEIVEPLYDDWAAALVDQRLARPQDKVVLGFVLSASASDDEACKPLALLLDDDDDSMHTLPRAGQRVFVHMDALWRRWAARHDAFNGAAKCAGRYRSLVASPAALTCAAVTASLPTSPLSTASAHIITSS